MPLIAATCCACVHFFQSIRLIFDNFPRFPQISLKLLSLNFFFQIVSLFEAGPLLPTWLGEGIELAGKNTKKGSREAIFIRWLHVTSECLQMRNEVDDLLFLFLPLSLQHQAESPEIEMFRTIFRPKGWLQYFWRYKDFLLLCYESENCANVFVEHFSMISCLGLKEAPTTDSQTRQINNIDIVLKCSIWGKCPFNLQM